MRILVFSDSHGRDDNILAALTLHPEADVIVHLGDVERDLNTVLDEIGSRKCVRVCGNCDWFSVMSVNDILMAGGKKLLCTHGHCENVKNGLAALREKAASIQADAVLFGHTHIAYKDCHNGIYAFNPGCMQNGEYGIIDVKDGKMTFTHKTL